jgi:hypothetical protein
MKTDINVPSKSNEQIKVRKKIYLVAILKATEEKSRIQIRGSGSATLVVIQTNMKKVDVCLAKKKKP